MIHSAAAVIGAYLQARGIFTDPMLNRPWPIYVNSLPDQPPELAVVYNTHGFIDGREFRGIDNIGLTIEHPGFQVLIRSPKNANADAKGSDVKNALDAIDGDVLVIAGHNYQLVSVRRTSPLIPLGEEVGGGRLLFTVNGTLTYQEV